MIEAELSRLTFALTPLQPGLRATVVAHGAVASEVSHGKRRYDANCSTEATIHQTD